MPSRKGEQFGFSTTCAGDVSMARGTKGDIKLHLATPKHHSFPCAAEKLRAVSNFFGNNNEVGVVCVPFHWISYGAQLASERE